jgi:hypothetical protein
MSEWTEDDKEHLMRLIERVGAFQRRAGAVRPVVEAARKLCELWRVPTHPQLEDGEVRRPLVGHDFRELFDPVRAYKNADQKRHQTQKCHYRDDSHATFPQS